MSDDAPPDVEDAEGGDPGAENGTGLQAALAGLPAGDRKLLWAFIHASLFTLGLGVLYALVLVMVKGGFIELESTLAYTVLGWLRLAGAGAGGAAPPSPARAAATEAAVLSCQVAVPPAAVWRRRRAPSRRPA